MRDPISYERFDDERFIRILNKIYRCSDLLANHFNACIQLESKHRVGSKIIKKYDTPKSPYQRILAEMKPGKKRDLFIKRHLQLDPIVLKEKLGQNLACMYELIKSKTREQGATCLLAPQARYDLTYGR